MIERNIIKINEDLCDGCGKCITSCAEGALKIVDGKAKLIGEIYCDGLGACIGECPKGALEIEQREATPFDHEKVEQHISKANISIGTDRAACPGTENLLDMKTSTKVKESELRVEEEESGSRLSNWPIQISLAPPKSQNLENCDLLVAADCVPFTFPDFHEKILKGRVLLVGCPKLDDHSFYLEKLSQMFIQNKIKSVTVVYMEVPCCFGMAHLIHEAILNSGKEMPLKMIRMSVKGNILMEKVEIVGGGSSG